MRSREGWLLWCKSGFLHTNHGKLTNSSFDAGLNEVPCSSVTTRKGDGRGREPVRIWPLGSSESAEPPASSSSSSPGRSVLYGRRRGTGCRCGGIVGIFYPRDPPPTQPNHHCLWKREREMVWRGTVCIVIHWPIFNRPLHPNAPLFSELCVLPPPQSPPAQLKHVSPTLDLWTLEVFARRKPDPSYGND